MQEKQDLLEEVTQFRDEMREKELDQIRLLGGKCRARLLELQVKSQLEPQWKRERMEPMFNEISDKITKAMQRIY